MAACFAQVTCEHADHICHQLMEDEVVIQWLSQRAVAKLQRQNHPGQVSLAGLRKCTHSHQHASATAHQSPAILIHRRRPLASIPKDLVLSFRYTFFNVKVKLRTLELTVQVPLRKDSRFRHTGIRIIMLLKFKHKADALAKAKVVWNRGEKRDRYFISSR